MSLSPEQEWTLVACGLMAHADGILDVGEWDQVLWMLDERIDAAETSAWLDRLANVATLRSHASGLPLPPPLFAESILEKAWRMGLADGRASSEELAVHQALVQQLGADESEVAHWRETWTHKAHGRSELIAGFAALIARADDEVSGSERAEFVDLLGRLPLREDARAAMENLLDEPPEMMMLVGGFAGLPPEERRIAMLGLVPIVAADDRGDAGRKAFIELAEAIAIDAQDAQRMLER